jgi:hypothetical protein
VSSAVDESLFLLLGSNQSKSGEQKERASDYLCSLNFNYQKKQTVEGEGELDKAN